MFVKSDFLKRVKLFVLDLDGTFYLGNRSLPGSLPFVEKVRETGRRFVFFTNNTSRTPEMYIEKITRMGLPVTRADILTAGDVTARFLREQHPGEPVYVLGTEALRAQFASQGVPQYEDAAATETAPTPNAKPRTGAAISNPPPCKIVVVAFDTELTYAKLERACTLIREGAAFLATHPDINCPTEGGFIPDCGALCAAVALSTGKQPRVFGKPHPEALDYVTSETGVSKNEICFVGDRLYTDVAAGVNHGAHGVLVLSGETKEADIAASETQPDAVFADLGELAKYI
jgi:phosphoglycolate/pyridoxal phosphate phosphatase family enzyme